jgi:hypothetical protein
MSDSTPQVTLVDIHGRPIVADDQGDAQSWPASNDVDGWHWEVSEDDHAALEAAALEAETDRHDAPSPGEARWLTLMWSEAAGLPALPPISGGAPQPFEPTAEDWADYHGWSEDLDRRRRSVSDVELSMMSAGLAIG